MHTCSLFNRCQLEKVILGLYVLSAVLPYTTELLNGVHITANEGPLKTKLEGMLFPELDLKYVSVNVNLLKHIYSLSAALRRLNMGRCLIN